MIKRRQPVPDASGRAMNPYAFVTCLGYGAPWSEQTEDTPFEKFMETTFGSAIDGAVPSEGQDMEFSCAHPTRSGSNSLLKGSAACHMPGGRETPRVVFSLRGLWLPQGRAKIIRSRPEESRSATKFWIAIQAKEKVTIPEHLANDRSSLYRRRPAELKHCLQADLLDAVREAVLETVSSAQKYVLQLRGQRQTTKRQKGYCTLDYNCLSCLEKLVKQLGATESFLPDRPSTTWLPVGDTVFAPADLLLRNCSCARLVDFPGHMAVNCRGLGINNVAQKTWFNAEPEIPPALLHADKSRELCLLRKEYCAGKYVLRLKVHEKKLECATLERATTFTTTDGWEKPRDNKKTIGKDRMVWVINVQKHPKIWENGTLHVIKAEMKTKHSHQITLEPGFQAKGRYVAVVLKWIGDRMYLHAALVRSASAPGGFGLGVLRPAFHITEPLQGLTLHCHNVLRGQVDPCSDFMRDELDERGIQLSEDQIGCMRTIDKSYNTHLKIEGFAGTGKSLVLSLLVKVALTAHCSKDDAVVIVTASSKHRDYILQGPDFLGSVFREEELGPRVVWLGQPSDSPHALCSWEERMHELVDERLLPERERFQECETKLQTAFEKIKTLDLAWTKLPSGTADVIGDEAFIALREVRTLALEYTLHKFKQESRRRTLMEDILAEERQGHLIVATMDAFIRWRAGKMEGYMKRFLDRLQINLFCLEDFEAFDVDEVVAALSNVRAKTLLMVGDLLQRADVRLHRRNQVQTRRQGSTDSFKVARCGAEDDGEQDDFETMGVAESSTDNSSAGWTVPETRPWYEWCKKADGQTLHLCKRYGKEVCDYIKYCFDINQKLTPHPRLACKTKLEHVFFDGGQWHCSPSQEGDEVAWHSLLFQSLCRTVSADVEEYKTRHPDIVKLPTPTVLVIMPLSCSAIHLRDFMQRFPEGQRIAKGVVRVCLPENTGEGSVPIVHCVRHRRSLQAADQYTGTQENMTQEYLNLTRGVEKTCMWVEMQPFGYPGAPWGARYHHAAECSHDAHSRDYAMRRNEYIWKNNLKWCLLEGQSNVSSSNYEYLPTGRGEGKKRSADDLHILAHKIPRRECLLDVERNSGARRCQVDEVLEWKAAQKFGHLLLPCATAVISSQAESGETHLCLPFIDTSGRRTHLEDGIVALCGLAYFLAFLLEKDLVATGRLWQVPHKPCTSSQLATAIKDGNKDMLYMYIGGHTICQQQSNLLSNLVVSCKSWRWAALLYAAARIATLGSSNSLGPLKSNLIKPTDEDERESTTKTVDSFQQVCESMWGRVCRTCKDELYETDENRYINKSMRSKQLLSVGSQLTYWIDTFADEVKKHD